ncbi:MAG: flagellar protein [Anaerocolumna sp.]
MDNKANLKKYSDDGKLGESKVCVRCKRMFTYLGFGHFYCPACKKIDEEDFAKVKEYIYDHGNASAMVVSEHTGISLARITQYLREGRLEIPEMSSIFIKCEMCSQDIRSGRLCPSCAGKLSGPLRESMNFDDEQVGQVPRKKEGKMRYFGKEK